MLSAQRSIVSSTRQLLTIRLRCSDSLRARAAAETEDSLAVAAASEDLHLAEA
jgi:hypothetical protein